MEQHIWVFLVIFWVLCRNIALVRVKYAPFKKILQNDQKELRPACAKSLSHRTDAIRYVDCGRLQVDTTVDIMSPRPPKQPLMARTFLKVYGARLLFLFVQEQIKLFGHHQLRNQRFISGTNAFLAQFATSGFVS
jgi:hypothetical protein